MEERATSAQLKARLLILVRFSSAQQGTGTESVDQVKTPRQGPMGNPCGPVGVAPFSNHPCLYVRGDSSLPLTQDYSHFQVAITKIHCIYKKNPLTAHCPNKLYISPD